MVTESAVGGRELAHRALMRVMKNDERLAGALDTVCKSAADERELRLARELAFGVMRWLPRLCALLAELLERPLKRRDRDIQGILLLGLYQLIYTRIPAHAAVAESVSLARTLRKPWSAGLVNASLRRFQRERDALLDRVNQEESARFSHPAWLIDQIRDAWPHHWRDILAANNAHPPMTLRVNARHGTRDAYLHRLHTAGIAAEPGVFTDNGIVLETPTDVRRLPEFAAGAVSVQDLGAQLAAPILEPAPGHRVLDACAAPGGKTAHLLEMENRLAEVVALDASADRVERLRDTLSRLALQCTVIHADAARPESWWDGKPFDRVLLDAPCTATGIIRRHPDIKFHRRPEDVVRLESIQSSLLDALWPVLARGGLLLYATCSILPGENRDRIANFLGSHSDAEHRPIDARWGRSDVVGRQILTGEHGMDGFYYALLAKR